MTFSFLILALRKVLCIISMGCGIDLNGRIGYDKVKGYALRLSELLEGIDHEVLKGDAYVGIQGISMDSREVKEGFAFVFIRGAVRDGHEFIDEALRAGAAALVIDGREDAVLEKANLGAVTVVYTKDSRAALAHMAAAWHGYPAQKLITIGITGTKGTFISKIFE